MEAKELKPCPFCASADVRIENFFDPYVACVCGANGNQTEDEDSAIAAWNRRAALPSDAAQAAQGWKLVPIDLTERMTDEADFAMQKHAGDDYAESDSFDGWFKPVWSAMLAAAPVAPAAAAPITEAQRKAIDDAARVLGENWEHETADRLTEAFVASGASAAATSEPADWRGDFERKATVSGFDLSREESGGDYCHDGPAAAWLWYYSGRLDQACAATTPTVAADAAAPSMFYNGDTKRDPELRESVNAPGTFDGTHANPLLAYANTPKPAAAQPDERAALDKIAAKLHYPACWDTAAYPTLASALVECVEWYDVRCGECDEGSRATAPKTTPTQLSTETVDKPVQMMSDAERDVLAERARQVSEEGWTPAHDDQHGDHEMSCAAGCYAMYTLSYPAGDPPPAWPWAADWWKPTTHRRNLIKAGALILAEIERIDRQGGSDAR